MLANLGATAVIARILSPDDYGLIAMVMIAASYLALFREMGLSAATIQKEDLTDGQTNSMFWINAVIGCLLTALTVALAPVLSALYHEPKVAPLATSFAICFALGGLSVQHRALLRRHLRFGALAAVDILRPVVSVTVGIGMALSGAGVWALVGMHIAGWSAETLGLWLACPWRPGRPSLSEGTRKMVSFGGFLTGFNLLNYFARNADKILIGRLCGATPLGLYAKAYELLVMPLWLINTPMSSVAIPTLAKLQSDPVRYRRAFGKAMMVITYMTTPITVVLAVLSMEIVSLLLGDQWLDSVRIFRVLAFVALGQPVAGATGWVFVSLGRGRRMFLWALISVPCYVASFAIGIRWGVMGVAVAYALCEQALRWPLLLFAYHGTPIRIRDLIAVCWRPFGLSLAGGLVMIAVRSGLLTHTTAGPVMRITLVVASAMLFSVVVLLISQAFRRDVRELVDYRHYLRATR